MRLKRSLDRANATSYSDPTKNKLASSCPKVIYSVAESIAQEEQQRHFAAGETE